MFWPGWQLVECQGSMDVLSCVTEIYVLHFQDSSGGLREGSSSGEREYPRFIFLKVCLACVWWDFFSLEHIAGRTEQLTNIILGARRMIGWTNAPSVSERQSSSYFTNIGSLIYFTQLNHIALYIWFWPSRWYMTKREMMYGWPILYWIEHSNV